MALSPIPTNTTWFTNQSYREVAQTSYYLTHVNTTLDNPDYIEATFPNNLIIDNMHIYNLQIRHQCTTRTHITTTIDNTNLYPTTLCLVIGFFDQYNNTLWGIGPFYLSTTQSINNIDTIRIGNLTQDPTPAQWHNAKLAVAYYSH